MKILVLAPRFPSLNQPWIDTYLEQLLKHNINFKIYSSLKSPGKYQSKVDELGLRKHILNLDLTTKMLIRVLFFCLLSRPIETAKQCVIFFANTKPVSTSLRSRIIAMLRSVYFAGKTELFRDVSLIHSHSEMSAFEFLHLRAQLGIPMLLTFHGLPPAGVDQLNKKGRQILYSELSGVLVNTEFAKKQVISLGAREQSIHIIPQGLPIEDFTFKPAVPPVQGQNIELLSIGRFHRDKGQRYALLALRRLIDAGYPVEWHFVGVGSGVEELRRFAARLNITDFTHFHVELSDDKLKRLYHKCHMFCLCSVDNAVHIETQGVVIQEAQASGCLVIATSVGGVPECIIDGQDGMLIKPRSSRAIYDAVLYFQNHPEVWERYLRAGRNNVENNFSADIIGEKMSKILNTLNRETLN